MRREEGHMGGAAIWMGAVPRRSDMAGKLVPLELC